MSLESVLAGMTYKPTYTFEVLEQVLRVTMHTHDSRSNEAPPLSIPVDFPLPDWQPEYDDDDWEAWLSDKLDWCELHEKDEWLRFNGVLYRDPHKEAMIR